METGKSGNCAGTNDFEKYICITWQYMVVYAELVFTAFGLNECQLKSYSTNPLI